MNKRIVESIEIGSRVSHAVFAHPLVERIVKMKDGSAIYRMRGNRVAREGDCLVTYDDGTYGVIEKQSEGGKKE